VRAPTACLLCWDPLSPEGSGWLAFAQAGLSSQLDCRSGYRAPSPGSGGGAANQSRAPG
jgi:hypothetical protein